MRQTIETVAHSETRRSNKQLDRAQPDVPKEGYPPGFEQIAREQFDRTAMRRRLLSPRQLEVTTLVAEGINNKEIAQRLGIGEEGVKKHIAAAMRKANVDRRTKLARWFFGQ